MDNILHACEETQCCIQHTARETSKRHLSSLGLEALRSAQQRRTFLELEVISDAGAYPMFTAPEPPMPQKDGAAQVPSVLLNTGGSEMRDRKDVYVGFPKKNIP